MRDLIAFTTPLMRSSIGFDRFNDLFESMIEGADDRFDAYPDAIKQAAKLIDDGKQDDAKKVLQTALNTLVITDTIIPLPVAAAQNMLVDAQKLAEKKDRSVDENQKLNDLLTASRSQLEYAETLGYGTRQDFKNLYAQLDDIKAKTSNGKSGLGFFDKITPSLAALFQSNRSGTGKDVYRIQQERLYRSS